MDKYGFWKYEREYVERLASNGNGEVVIDGLCAYNVEGQITNSYYLACYDFPSNSKCNKFTINLTHPPISTTKYSSLFCFDGCKTSIVANIDI